MSEVKSIDQESPTLGEEATMSKPSERGQESIRVNLKQKIMSYVMDRYEGFLRVDVVPVADRSFRVNLYQTSLYGGSMLDSWFIVVEEVQDQGGRRLDVDVIEGPDPDKKFTKHLMHRYYDGQIVPSDEPVRQ